jgi:hypothetical protein
MSLQIVTREQARPPQTYKREFQERVMSLSPDSLLDVGCGEAELLMAAAAAGCPRCTGIEPDQDTVSKMHERGLDVRLGRAESLPFDDRSFDVITFDYVAHHVEFLEDALLEAARVARRAVLILDPWYDISLPSQQTARDFDDWMKIIDRRLGRVHNPCIDPARLTAAFRSLGEWQIDYSCRLLYQDMPLSRIESTAREQLATLDGCQTLEGDLVRLLDRMRLHGITDDGALTFVARRE